MKLYHSPRTRADRIRWLLSEINKDHEIIPVDIRNKDPKYLKIHPFGQVPALDDNGTVMFESVAIMMYLAEKYGATILLPPDNQKAHYYQWLMFGCTTLEPLIEKLVSLKRRPGSEEEVMGVIQKLQKVLSCLDSNLMGKNYILGDQFTTPDILIGLNLSWLKSVYPEFSENLENYLVRVKNRPGYQVLRAR